MIQYLRVSHHTKKVFTKLFPFSEVIPISALKRKNIDILEKEITKRLPVGAHLYPEDQIADSSERFLASEIIREKCISRN